MWLRRSRETLKPLLRLRSFSRAAAAALSEAEEAINSLFLPLEYLEGSPRPDPKHSETILAVPRENSGKNIAAKERKVGRVPSILFEQENGQEGGNKRLISVQTNQIKKLVNHLGRSFFLSRLFDLEVRSDLEASGELIEKVRVLPRKVGTWNAAARVLQLSAHQLGLQHQLGLELGAQQLRFNATTTVTGEHSDDQPQLHLHSGTDAVLNVTFLRAPSSALLKVEVPLVFRGEDVCPGLRKGAYLNTIKRTVKYLCPADIIPPYIDVDLSELDVGEKLVMQDLKVHPALQLLHPANHPICNIIGSRAPEQKKSK